MAGFTAAAAVLCRRNTCSPRFVVVASAVRSSQLGHGKAARRAVHEAVGEARQTARVIKAKAKVAADEVAKTTKEAAGMATDTAQSVTDKAKKAMKDSWGKATEATQKMKESVVGKAEDAMDAVKDTAEAAKGSMKRN